jgi:two-component system, NarL family, sensor histidine kinase DevS
MGRSLTGNSRSHFPTVHTGTKVTFLGRNTALRDETAGTSTVIAVNPTLDSALLIHAVDRSPDGVLIVDFDGVIHFANASIARLAGRPAEEFVGRSVDELVPESLRPAHRAHRQSFAASPDQRPMGAGIELTLRRQDGLLVPVEISLSPLEHDGQRYVIAAVRDVTERVESHRRLAAANEQLTLASERARIGRDLHDVVLQHLYGTGLSVQAAAMSPDASPDLTTKLEAIVDDVDRIISEVRTIVFTLGTSGAGTGSPDGPLGQELADVMAQANRVLGFTPSFRLEGPVESVITDDVRTEMVASMREALGNVARHATASTAEVLLELDGNHLVMRVSDNGVGPPADLAQAYRGGHGLANLRSRAASLGGSCALTSGPSGGAVLLWTVPFS